MGLVRSLAKRAVERLMDRLEGPGNPGNAGGEGAVPPASAVPLASSATTAGANAVAPASSRPATSANTIPPASSPTSTSANASEAGSSDAPARGSATAVDLESLKTALRPRGRPLIVHHWATWCEPCAEELPRIERLFQRLAGTADLVGVSWDLFDPSGPPEQVARAVERFAAQAGVTWPTLLFTGSPEALFEGLELDFQRIPQTRVVDADGRELRSFHGPIEDEDVDALVATLTASGS